MLSNYKTRNAVLSLLTVICFVFSTVLVCYADNIKINGDTEKKDYSLFSSSRVAYYICLPTDKLSEVSNDKNCIHSYATKKYSMLCSEQMNMFRLSGSVLQGASYMSGEIITNMYKKDGKK